MRTGVYQTAIIGKWHVGEGVEPEPSGFDFWSVVPGQGEYYDPIMIEMGVEKQEFGYATAIITDRCIDWMDKRDNDKPFFLMYHHKSPHRSWECDNKHKHLYQEDIKVPETFSDDYENRAEAAAAAKMKVDTDMAYFGLAQPEVGQLLLENLWSPATPVFETARFRILKM
jgi:arylsulfatase A-like enzyme